MNRTQQISTDSWLVCAFDVDKGGQAHEISAAALDDLGDAAWRWIHLDRTYPETASWLRDRSPLPSLAVDALLAEETRPRVAEFGGDSLILVLRGVNLNPGAELTELISVRAWVSQRLVVTVRRSPMRVVQDIRDAYARAEQPLTPGSFVAALAEGLTGRMTGPVRDMEDRLDDLEDDALKASRASIRSETVELRRKALQLRRYLSPQRDAMSELLRQRTGLLNTSDKDHIREAGDELARIVETLDMIRDRAGLLREELANLLAEEMNRTTYVLTVVAAVFLPLGFLTGLLGINVGGIPGVEHPWAFPIVSASLVVLGIAEIALFRRLRWL